MKTNGCGCDSGCGEAGGAHSDERMSDESNDSDKRAKFDQSDEGGQNAKKRGGVGCAGGESKKDRGELPSQGQYFSSLFVLPTFPPDCSSLLSLHMLIVLHS